MKVTTKDFQILEGENTFEFNEGINMVVGPNGSGKSSLFYAVENCLTNPSGVSDCINYNSDKAEVKLEVNNESVSWIRTPESSIYKNNKNKKEFVKASKLDSRDIADLGFYFDKKNRVVNIHDEWSILFPFGESDSDTFRLFEDIFNISCSFLVIDEMKKDEQTIKSYIVQNQKQKEDLNIRLEKLNEIKEKVKLSDIENYLNLVVEKEQLTSKLREDYTTFSKSALLQNITLPKVFDVTELYNTYNKLQNIEKDFNVYQNISKKVNITIPKINLNLDDIKEPKDLKTEYEQYCLNKAQVETYEDELKEINKRKIFLTDEISKIKVCPTCGRPL